MFSAYSCVVMLNNNVGLEFGFFCRFDYFPYQIKLERKRHTTNLHIFNQKTIFFWMHIFFLGNSIHVRNYNNGAGTLKICGGLVCLRNARDSSRKFTGPAHDRLRKKKQKLFREIAKKRCSYFLLRFFGERLTPFFAFFPEPFSSKPVCLGTRVANYCCCCCFLLLSTPPEGGKREDDCVFRNGHFSCHRRPLTNSRKKQGRKV